MGAWLKRTVGGYAPVSQSEGVASLVREHARTFSDQRSSQVVVWDQTFLLTDQLCEFLVQAKPDSRSWTILYEFEIPRRRKRPDLVLLADDVIFVIELKWGAREFDAAARWQVEEYALDLRDFHEGSSGRRIVPVLVATEAPSSRSMSLGDMSREGKSFVLCCS